MTEVFEIIDTLTNKRAKERVWLTASDALDAMEQYGEGFRVQSVAVVPEIKHQGGSAADCALCLHNNSDPRNDA